MKRVSTGILGLDGMLGGGFLEGRIVLVKGGPGSGKTVFSIQYIMDGVKKGERGVYVTLEEPFKLIKENMRSLGWNLENLEREGLIKIIDKSALAYGIRDAGGREAHGPQIVTRLTNEIRSAVEDIKVKRLAVDPITSLAVHLPFPDQKRTEIGRLFETLRTLSCTSVVTSEILSTGDFYMEEYLADGAIVLSKIMHQFSMIKIIRIEKMRGLKHDDQPRRYEITEKGLVVYNTEPVIIE